MIGETMKIWIVLHIMRKEIIKNYRERDKDHLVSNTGNTRIGRTVETKSLSLIINRDKNHNIS